MTCSGAEGVRRLLLGAGLFLCLRGLTKSAKLQEVVSSETAAGPGGVRGSGSRMGGAAESVSAGEGESRHAVELGQLTEATVYLKKF